MNIKKNIPNAITCCNLLCGCLAIVQAMNGNLVWAAYLVGLAAVFDFFDGFAARLLKVSSPIGKDLDSLADMVTFGVVPGIVMFKLFSMAVKLNNFEGCADCVVPGHYVTPGIQESYLPYLSMIIPIFSGIRLAKFNNDSRQSDSFIGVPTPANAIFICSLALLVFESSGMHGSIYPTSGAQFLLRGYMPLILATVIFSALLVAELPLFALKFKHFKWKGNEIRFIFLILCMLMLATLRLVGIPLCIVLYILMSVINNFITKRRGTIAG